MARLERWRQVAMPGGWCRQSTALEALQRAVRFQLLCADEGRGKSGGASSPVPGRNAEGVQGDSADRERVGREGCLGGEVEVDRSPAVVPWCTLAAAFLECCSPVAVCLSVACDEAVSRG